MARAGIAASPPSRLYSSHFPRVRIIPCVVPNKVFADTPPIKIKTSGATNSIWRSINGIQAAISESVGVRFPGGRHGKILVI